MNKLIQALEERDIKIDYYFNDDGNYYFSINLKGDIYTKLIYSNSSKNMTILDTIRHDYLMSSNNKKVEFISYLEKKFNIKINSTNLDLEYESINSNA